MRPGDQIDLAAGPRNIMGRTAAAVTTRLSTGIYCTAHHDDMEILIDFPCTIHTPSAHNGDKCPSLCCTSVLAVHCGHNAMNSEVTSTAANLSSAQC